MAWSRSDFSKYTVDGDVANNQKCWMGNDCKQRNPSFREGDNYYYHGSVGMGAQTVYLHPECVDAAVNYLNG